jgi:hypothetical protein
VLCQVFFYLIFNLFIKHLIISILWYFFFNYLVNNYKISCFSLITCTIFIHNIVHLSIYIHFLGINKILIFLFTSFHLLSSIDMFFFFNIYKYIILFLCKVFINNITLTKNITMKAQRLWLQNLRNNLKAYGFYFYHYNNL